MNHFTNLNSASGVRRLALVALALAAFVPSSLAGTYSVIGADWYPSNSPGQASDGAYIRFDPNNGLDLDYGMTLVASAPDTSGGGISNSVSVSGSPQGTWKWKVRWVGQPGETHPVDVSAISEFYGLGSVEAGASVFTAGYSAEGDGTITDKNFNASMSVSTSTAGPGGQVDQVDSTGQEAFYIAQGCTGFTQVAGTTNTWDGYVLMSVSASGGANATGHGYIAQYTKGQPIYAVDSAASTTSKLNVTVRLTQVDGQQVQPNLNP